MKPKSNAQKAPLTKRAKTKTDSSVLHLPNIVDLFSESIQTHDIAYSDNLAYMRRFPDEFFNLIVTSPPYNVGKAYEKRATQEGYGGDLNQERWNPHRVTPALGAVADPRDPPSTGNWFHDSLRDLGNLLNPVSDIMDVERALEGPITEMTEGAKAGRQRSLERWLEE
jgi:hypothetical protein